MPTLEVEVAGDTVELRLQVTNAADTAVTLEFGSAQRYDFEVRTEGGESVWVWSADRMFGQVVGHEKIAPGSTLEYRERWDAGGRRGRLQARARLTSATHPLELTASFEAGS